jgi:hypothetical protein
MQRLLPASLVVAAIGLILPAFTLAIERSEAQPILSPAIHGELIKMEGEIYTVKDKTGRTQQLRIDRETKIVGVFRTGDYVQAWVLPDGRTESIIAYKDMGQSLPTQP